MNNGKFGFRFLVDDVSKEEFNHIMENFKTVDKDEEIVRTLLQGKRELEATGKSLLVKRERFKYSGSVPGYRTGHLYNSLTGNTTYTKNSISLYAGFKRGKGGGNHAHLIDRGTVLRYTRKGHYRGSVSAGHPNFGNMFWTVTVRRLGPKIQNNLSNAIHNAFQRMTKSAK